MTAASVPPRILVIAGSDSGGGAGIQADIKTISAFGGFATTAITAVTAQNSLGVSAVHPVPTAVIGEQMDAIIADIGVDAVKIGMLHDDKVINIVADKLPADVPLVLDPVMVATSGAQLLESSAQDRLVARLFPAATLVTPNLPEAEALTGEKIADAAAMIRAAKALLDMGARAVLLKGGHLEGDVVRDLLMSDAYVEWFTSPKISTRHTHGTGCTLASAIAVQLGGGAMLKDAVSAARDYVKCAIEYAPGFGAGHGPLGHEAAARCLS